MQAQPVHQIMGALSLWTRLPGPVPVYRALKNLPFIQAVKTDSWNLSLRHHSDVHTAQELHLRHLQDLSCATTGMSMTRQELQLWEPQFSARLGPPHRKLHDLHNRDVDNFVQQQENLFGHKDYGDLPLRDDRDDDDHDELQPWNFRSFMHGAITAPAGPYRPWWLWCGRLACMTCLSMPHSCLQRIRVACHVGVRLPATPPRLPRPSGEGQPYRHIYNRQKCTCGTQSSKLNTCTISMICGMTPRSAPHRENSNCETSQFPAL